MLDASGEEAYAKRAAIGKPSGASVPRGSPLSRQRRGSCTPPKYGRHTSHNNRPSHPSVCGRRLRTYSS